MTSNAMFKRIAFVVAGLLFSGCADGGDSPTETVTDAASSVHAMHPMPITGVASTLAPFTFRAPLEPYVINQPPEFMIRSRERTDIVIQQSVFAPGAGPWHTHPGPSFVYVIQGQIKLDRATRSGECVSTPVHGPGEAYFEIANQVHRAVVVSSDSAVVLVTRFNIPVGGAITIPAADPGC